MDTFPSVGALAETDAARALQDPAQATGAAFDADALTEIFRLTMGYPYFVQEWGYQAWNLAEGPRIDLATVRRATEFCTVRLDQNFFRVQFDRLTRSEKRFLRAMAEHGGGPHRIGEIAATLRVRVASLGPVRAKLIRKGMVYSPAHGEMAFTVPLFDEFMRRAMPQLEPR